MGWILPRGYKYGGDKPIMETRRPQSARLLLLVALGSAGHPPPPPREWMMHVLHCYLGRHMVGGDHNMRRQSLDLGSWGG